MSNPEIIPFNKPFIIGKELEYIRKAVESGHISGNGDFSKACELFFEKRYSIHKALLTSSCTDALEMAAILLGIKPGDEIIAPSFSFVSTVNPFVLRGAKIIFADSLPDHPNMDVDSIEALITKKTKAIVCVHYAGVACDMEKLKSISAKAGIPIVEDAAHSIEAKWNGKQLGTIGSLGTFSFHETKNVICGEGGLLAVNDSQLIQRAEIIREKGTNRPAFYRGEIKKYEWVDIGSSFLPSELSAAYLFAQLENIDRICTSRLKSWSQYASELTILAEKKLAGLPVIPEFATHNGHIFYLVLPSAEKRNSLQDALQKAGIKAVFHYQSLHDSPFYKVQHDSRSLPHADRFSNCLLRLPLYHELSAGQISRICQVIKTHLV